MSDNINNILNKINQSEVKKEPLTEASHKEQLVQEPTKIKLPKEKNNVK